MENIVPETEIIDNAERIFRDLLPNKSKCKYEAAYNEFMAWLKTKKYFQTLLMPLDSLYFIRKK